MRRLIFLVFILAGCTFTETPKNDWGIISLFDGQIFPSYTWAVSSLGSKATTNDTRFFYGDPTGQLGVGVKDLKAGQTVRLEIEENDVMEKSSFEYRMVDTMNYFILYPSIPYKWKVLESWRQPQPVNLNMSLFVNDKKVSSLQKSMTVRGINECPYTITSPAGLMQDFNYVYISYVNENHPVISEEILPEIMKQGVIDKVTGYQMIAPNDYDEVFRQVYAVWHYFNKNKFHYSSLTTNYKGTVTDAPMVQAQYVRTFSEIFKTKEANCVEGTVLMASILTKMGISSYLVTTPNHCFLGFSVDGSDDRMAFLETTLLDSDISQLDAESQLLIKNTSLTKFDHFMRLSFFGKSTYDNFVWATLQAMQTYQKNKTKFRKDSAETDFIVTPQTALSTFEKINYRMLSVDYYRRLGLIPINQ